MAGTWTWHHAEDRAEVRRIEREVWTLRVRGTSVNGEYRRTARLQSLDGTPFECNQHVIYELVTTYQVQGRIVLDARGDWLDLHETRYETASSPCESSHRSLGAYRGRLRRPDALELSWKGGRQVLNRAVAPDPVPAEPHPEVAGTWRWNNRTVQSADQRGRVELEQWELTESENGELSGTYLRTVTVFDESGGVFDCSGQSYYQYRDRYTVRGAIEGTRVVLSETEVDPEPHDCNASDQRHLDTAIGEVVGGYLVLAWRGRNRQVLRRPAYGTSCRTNRPRCVSAR